MLSKKQVSPTRSKTYKAVDTEWRVLGALLDTKNSDWVNRIADGLFTEERVRLFHSMRDSVREYGTITFEGLTRFYGPVVPGELLAAQGANINAAVDEAARIA